MKVCQHLMSVVCLLFCVTGLLCLSGCANDLQIEEMPETLCAGDTYQISPTYKGEAISADLFYFASADPSIATVSEVGNVTAVRQGQTTIHMQHKQDTSIKTTVRVNVAYEVVDEIEPFHSRTETLKTGYSNSDHPFFERNGYEMRMDDWDILAIVKLVASKNEDDYAFTDMYSTAVVDNETFITLADWGNEDMTIDPLVLNQIDLSQYLVAQENLTYDGFGKVGEDQAMHTIKSQINPQMQNMGYAIALSELSDEYEYRVSIKVDYHVYRTVNFYSRGLVGGGWNVILDLVKLDISSFLNSYTYSKECYEVVLDDCHLVIEQRPKQ